MAEGKLVSRRKRLLASRLCASSLCPHGVDGQPKVFTPVREGHVFCCAGCASYERIRRWRMEKVEKAKEE